MKQPLLMTFVAFGLAVTALADTIAATAGTTYTNSPAIVGSGAAATITGYPGSPFWNNSTSDAALGSGTKGNAGYFLQNIGDFSGGNAFLGGAGVYRSDSTIPSNAPNAFTFLQGGSSISATLLLTSSGQNFGANGTRLFVYDTTNIANTQTLWSAGQLWNSAGGGLFNNGSAAIGSFANSVGGTTSSTVSASTFASWGLGATTCTDSVAGTGCNTFYSNAGLNTGGGESGISPHNHFAVFLLNSVATTYYVGFEDHFGLDGIEGVGDYNDAIFRISTSAAGTPEPGTILIVGLGLLGVGYVRRRMQSKRSVAVTGIGTE